jgi:hypothetical protein
MTSIQTTVDDEIADAFTAWATENYKSKAAALRDYIIKAPKGESVHSNVTNADLEAQIEELEETIESGSFSGHQQQNENQSESDAEDADPIEMYDPEVGADDLPDDLTPEYGDAACIRKDILEGIVEGWEETGEVPALNPTHISSDNRPQGGDTAVALGLAIIKYRFGGTVRHSSIVDVLASDNGGLGYTKQYVRENGHAHDIADTLVAKPDDESTYILREDRQLAALDKYQSRVESGIDDIQNPVTVESFVRSAEELAEDHKAALALLESVDSDAHDIEIPDIMPAINAGGDQIYADQFYNETDGVEEYAEELPEDLTEMRNTDDLDRYIDIHSTVSTYTSKIKITARHAFKTLDDQFAGGIDDGDIDRLKDLLMSTSVLKIKLDDVVEGRDAEMRSRMARRVDRRVTGAKHLADMALEVDTEDGVSVIGDALDAVADAEDLAKSDEHHWDIKTGFRWGLASEIEDHRDEIMSE